MSFESDFSPNFSPGSYPLLHEVQQRGIRHLALWQLELLAAELRRSLLEIVPYTGGHLASNLGTVELTIALHYAFDSPKDALVWDVGHQAYAHKMLTGRWRDFASLRKQGGLYGFPRRQESRHDYLNSGHAGTAISAGLGLELGRRLGRGEHRGQNQGKVLCIVGDASLTSGMAFEALNHCGHQANSLVVILNDNEMSIAPNVGAISRILSRLTAGHSYVFLRDHINQFIRQLPLLGLPAYRALLRLKGVIKKACYRTNLFTEFGFKYIGPIDGHNTKLLLDTFGRIAQLNEPVLLHVCTQKGKGLAEAEKAPAKYHGVAPRVPCTSLAPQSTELSPPKNFTEGFRSALLDLQQHYDNLVCISAAMAASTGLQAFAELHPQRFFDVGIAEQHALTLAAGLALAGQIPLVAIYSTFMQRAMDQLIHDISLMRLPVILVCDRAGLVPGDGDTHQGIYDIVQFRSVIDLELYSPATQPQLYACLEYALQRAQQAQQQQEKQHHFGSGPVVIRLPKRNCLPSSLLPGVEAGRSGEQILASDYPAPSTAVHTKRALLLCTGSLLSEALAAQGLLAEVRQPILLDVVQLCRLAPLPQLDRFFSAHCYDAIYCTEDGVVAGGIGQELLRYHHSREHSQICPMFLRGVERQVPQLGNYQQLLQGYGLDAQGLSAWVEKTVQR